MLHLCGTNRENGWVNDESAKSRTRCPRSWSTSAHVGKSTGSLYLRLLCFFASSMASIEVMQYCTFVLSCLLTPTISLTRPIPGRVCLSWIIFENCCWFLVSLFAAFSLTNTASRMIVSSCTLRSLALACSGVCWRIVLTHFKNRVRLWELQRNYHPLFCLSWRSRLLSQRQSPLHRP